MTRFSLRPWRRAARALAGLGLWSALAAHALAQDGAVYTTRSGQRFSLDSNLRPVDSPPAVRAELAFSDGTSEPLRVFVTTHKAAGQSFPIEDDSARHKLAEGVSSGARAKLTDFNISAATLGAVDKEQRNFSFSLSAQGASLASRMLAESEQGPTWQAVRSAGQDGTLLRCLLAELLNGASAVDAKTLDRKAIPAAISCRTNLDRVERFIEFVDNRAFAPSRWQLTAVASASAADLLVWWVVAPVTRAAEGSKLALSIAAELTSSAHQARLGAVHTLGVALGAFLAIVSLGGGIAWLAVRLTGASPTLSVAAPLAVLHASALLGLCLGPVDLTPALVQLGVYVVASVWLFKPLQRWVVKHSGQSLVSDQDGLSTLEYSILFLVVLISAIGLWSKLGDRLYTLGLGSGLLQGYTPGGFIAPSPDTASQPFELGRELG
ncbi:MAG TPA: hypothetical protein VFN67_11530, partial [Polyangiales bacterium]|nr:hypothetical protein [Polyangiales bacterium]